MKYALILSAALAGTLMADPAALFAEKCASCHGADGKMGDVSGKVIAGQAAADLSKKLAGYKAGSFGGAQKDTMSPAAKELSDAQIAALADYIAKLK